MRKANREQRGKPAIQRFMEKVMPEPNTGCWIWDGATDRDGYGAFQVKTRTTIRAHRFIYEHTHGVKLGRAQYVCHSCDTPSCVNPSHLWVGDNSANQVDAARKGRHAHQRLSMKQALEIRKRRLNGEKIASLANEFGIVETYVINIAKGVKWRHADHA